jgi:hypothetical protein
MAMQRIVRRVEIEDDLLGRRPVRPEEEVDEQALIAAAWWPILW